MYVCDICGTRFDAPAILTERVWHREVGAYETLLSPYCPICGEQYFDEEKNDEDTDD